MSTMRKTIAIATVGAALATIPAMAGAAASDTRQSFRVTNFDTLSVGGPYTVHVKTGPAASVTAHGPADQMRHVEVEMDGRTLKLRTKKQSGWKWWGREGRVDKIVVNVTVPMLDEATMAGSGKIDIDRISGSRFKGSVAGSGDLVVNALKVGALELSIAGSGDISAKGAATNAKYSIAGSGDIRAEGINVTDLEVTIAGSGDVAARATRTAHGKIAGSGDVVVTGGAKCTSKVAGSGRMRCS